MSRLLKGRSTIMNLAKLTGIMRQWRKNVSTSNPYNIILTSFLLCMMLATAFKAGSMMPRVDSNVLSQMSIRLMGYDECKDVTLVEGKIGDTRIAVKSGENDIVRLLKVEDIPTFGDASPSYDMYVLEGNDIVSDNLIATKQWETAFISQILSLMLDTAKNLKLPRHKVVFVDIGANIGAISIAVAAEGYRVIAVEAMDSNVQAFKSTMCINPWLKPHIQLHHTALGKEEAECVLFSGLENVGDGSMSCQKGFQVPEGYKFRERISLKTLDSILPLFGDIRGRVAVVKLDCEGAEPWIVEGGRVFLESIRPYGVVTEVSSMSESVTNTTTYQFMKYMSQWYDIRSGFFGEVIPLSDLEPGSVTAPTGEISNIFLTRNKGLKKGKGRDFTFTDHD